MLPKDNTLELDLPLKIDFDSKGMFSYSPYINFEYNSSEMFFCPESHFTCVSLQQVCLPVYLRCNGVNDCPGHEDEAACDRYTCPGFYRCRASQVCVHESHVCDGIYHCPQHDDEILCNETCPHNCVCHGWAFGCSGIFHAASYPNLRYVNASGTAMNLIDFKSNIYLVHLILLRCNITMLYEVTLPNLRFLDLSNNKLTHISNNLFTGLTRLESLKLNFNPLNELSLVETRQTSSLKILDLSNVLIPKFNSGNIFLPTLTTLNLSGSNLDHVTGQGFEGARSLSLLDLRRCPMTIFPREIFYNLSKLQEIFADNYKLCCPAILPLASIYWSVHTNSMSAQNTLKSRKEVTIAKRLITVVMSDFLCWFPVGLTEILASNGIPISGEVNVGIAIFVLPINAAVNPFLYTINIYLELRRRRREEERRKRIIDQLKFSSGFAGNAKTTLTTNDTMELLKTLLTMKTFSHMDLQKMLQEI
ncbi:relaxin receptor 1-like [Pomacea canaliculata]|uniref:relaxin receptor 1-like n=1 Tax=Pomacea canaliculata TaxID=400727 RepID=UPI000D73E4C4|nr:relaxin receptor 1-like [Pomacea canaliculata]